MSVLKIADIMEYLPHRYPFLLIDKVLEYSDEYVKAIKNVTINEEFFNGHFPSKPVMPGVLLIEAIAQAGAFLSYSKFKESAAEMQVLFTSIDGVKFRRVIEPGDQLILECGLVKKKRDFLWMSGKITVDGELACEAKMSAIVKFKE